MIDEKLLRRIVREELDRPKSADRALLTIPEVMAAYRTNRVTVLALIKAGKLRATARPVGASGRERYWIHTDSAERHFTPGAR